MAHAVILGLPVHPRTGLRAVGVVAGRPVWPILGGEESAEAAAQAAARAAEAAAQSGVENDRGFPDNTPLEQMSSQQRENYWKFQARKHEDRNKAFGGLTPEALSDLRAKAKRADELDLELGTTADKAAAKAAEDARSEARDQYLPDVINSRLDAAAARAGVSEDDLTKAIEFVDTSKFVGADGKVDADKVKAFIATLAPAKGTNDRIQQQRGPTPRGQGSGHRSAAGSGSSVASGRDLWNERNPTRAVTTSA